MGRILLVSILLSGRFQDVIITGKHSPSEPDCDAEWKTSHLKVGELNKLSICGRDYWKSGNCGGGKGEGEYSQEHWRDPLETLVMDSGSRGYP